MNMFKDLDLLASKVNDRCLTETIDRLMHKNNAKDSERKLLLAFCKEQSARGTVLSYEFDTYVV